MTTYLPLAVGNTWTYKMNDGKTFTNSVIAVDGNAFSMTCSTQEGAKILCKEGDLYLADQHEAGNIQVVFKEGLKKGDTWEIKYKANGIDNILIMTVMETGMTREVEGKTFQEVLMVEGDLKMSMNGNMIDLNYKTQYYYAAGVGLVLTTSSAGDNMPLVDYKRNASVQGDGGSGMKGGYSR